MNTGDKVLVGGWTLDSGYYVEHHEVTNLTEDSVQLKHTGTSRRGADGVEEISGNGRVTTYGKKMIDHLSIPFEERWQQLVGDIKWLCEQLSRP